jgi:cyclase
LDAIEWAKAVSLGAGEIVLNSIDADGTKAGFDLVVTGGWRAVGVCPWSPAAARQPRNMASVAGRQGGCRAGREHFHFGEYTVGM